MVRGRAVVSTVIFGVALLAAVAALLHLGGGGGANSFRAEFRDAFPLVPGDDVRMWGAKVGSVSSMQLTGDGTVSVTVDLLSGVAAPRADATASVRAGDLLGSAYLDLSPGRSAASLRGPIPIGRTFVTTSVQDFLNSYDTPTRAAFSLLLDELGAALEGRGVDLNRAVLELAPAIQQATRLSAQVADERARLGDLVLTARAVAGSVAPRARDLTRLIDAFEETFNVTAANGGALDRGLAELPAALAATRATLAQLETAAAGAQPLAQQLLGAAPTLAVATRRLAPFAGAAGAAARSLTPLVRSLGATLSAGSRTFPRLTHTLEQIRAAAPGVDRFSAVFDPLIYLAIKGSFGGLGRLASEPGVQAFESLPGRNWFRTVGVLGCESFGVPTAPGCMANILLKTAGSPAAARRPAAANAAPVTPVKPPARLPQTLAGVPLPHVPAVPSIPFASPIAPLTQTPAAAAGAAGKLLHFLLGR
ncbi:MAG: MlaD family protein [Solirubrobacteraceae bacterium]